ncbi:unnamed protein product [Natator depressus]
MTISASRRQPCEAISAGAQAEEAEGELAAALFGCGRCGCDLTHSGRVSRSASLQLTRGAASSDCPEASFIPPTQEAGGQWKLLCWHCKQSHPSPPFYLFILVVTPWQRQQ